MPIEIIQQKMYPVNFFPPGSWEGGMERGAFADRGRILSVAACQEGGWMEWYQKVIPKADNQRRNCDLIGMNL